MTKKLNNRVTLTNDLSVNPYFYEGKTRALIENEEKIGYGLNVYADFLPEGFEFFPLHEEDCFFKNINKIITKLIGNRKYILDINLLKDFKEICPDFYQTAESNPEIEEKKEELEMVRLGIDIY